MLTVSILDIKTTAAILKEMASCVVLPGEEGEFSVMDFHQEIVACLKEGMVRVDEKHFIRIKKGIARMERNELSILVEQ
jgi:F0F1-type ATP synthase epsilon subunit